MPSSLNFGLVREATQLAKARGLDDVSPAMLEGFVAAKVLVEACAARRPASHGPACTRRWTPWGATTWVGWRWSTPRPGIRDWSTPTCPLSRPTASSGVDAFKLIAASAY